MPDGLLLHCALTEHPNPQPPTGCDSQAHAAPDEIENQKQRGVSTLLCTTLSGVGLYEVL